MPSASSAARLAGRARLANSRRTAALCARLVPRIRRQQDRAAQQVGAGDDVAELEVRGEGFGEARGGDDHDLAFTRADRGREQRLAAEERQLADEAAGPVDAADVSVDDQRHRAADHDDEVRGLGAFRRTGARRA